MSASMYYREPPETRRPHSVGFEAKRIIAGMVWEDDGSVSHEPARLTPDESRMERLRGLRDWHPDIDVRRDLEEFVKFVEENNGAEVWVSR